MYRGGGGRDDYNGGGSRYGDNNNDGGGGRNNKRSYDDDGGNSHYGGGGGDREDRGGDDGGGYKRARHEGRDGGSSYYRPRNNNGGGDYRNGGGDRRSGNNNSNSNYDRRGSSSGGGNYGSESDQARAWRLTKKAIVELGDDASSADQQRVPNTREQLDDVVAKINYELEGDRNDVKLKFVATLIVRGAGRLPHKASLYAVLVGLVNEKQRGLGRSVIDAALTEIQKDLDFFHSDSPAVKDETTEDEDALRKAQDVNAVAQRLRLLVRFLGELVSTRVVKGEDLLSVLDSLQAVCTPEDFNGESDDGAVSLQARESAAAFKDYFASVVLDTLLHVGQALVVGNEDIYDSLLSRCKEYISNREEESNPRGIDNSSAHAANWLERRLRLELVWEPERDEESFAAVCKKCDLLSLQWEALNLIRAEASPVADGNVNPHLRWKLPGELYPQELYERHFTLSVEPHALNTGVSINFSSLDFSKIPRYEAVFRILGEDSGATGAPLANLHLAAYLAARGDLSDAIEAFHPKPSIAAKQLVGLTKGYNARFEKAEVANLKTEYVLLESLLVKALNEKDAARHGYLCSVLTQVVKADARLVSPALAIVVELLFREVPMMNASAVDAFVKLFSHFLSNFEFKWAWARWAHVLESPEDDVQRLFVSSVIERCVRLSYLQNMQGVLPAEFHVLLPPEPKPRVIYNADGNDESNVSSSAKNFFQEVSNKLKSHPPATALNAWLEEELNSGSGIDRNLAVDIVFTAILDAGSATFTHCRLMLEKYGAVGDFFSGEEAELLLVKTVGFVWVNSPLHIGIILNIMLRQRVIQSSTIAKWIFTSDAIQQYSWPYVWGILDETLTFVRATIVTAKRDQLKRTSNGDADMGEDETVAGLEEELRKLLKFVFIGFNRVIAEYKSNCDADGISYKDNWFVSALSQMKAVGGKFRLAFEEVADDLAVEVFNASNADFDAKKVFEYVRDSYRSS